MSEPMVTMPLSRISFGNRPEGAPMAEGLPPGLEVPDDFLLLPGLPPALALPRSPPSG